MHLLALRAVANALSDRLTGVMVRQAGMIDPQSFGLTLASDPPAVLILSVAAGAPLAWLQEGDSQRWNRALTDQLGGAAQALAGATIRDLCPVGWERVLALHLTPHHDSEATEPLHLLLELLPRTPFLVVTRGAEHEITAAIRAPGTQRADARSMERGAAYRLPFAIDLAPRITAPREFAVSSALEALAGGEDARRGLLRGVTDDEIAAVCATEMTSGSESSAGAEEAVRACAEALVSYRGPLLMAATPGSGVLLRPALPHETTAEAAPDDSHTPGIKACGAPLDMARRYGRAAHLGQRADRARRAIEGYVKRSRKRLQRTRQATQRELAGAQQSDALRRQGEALLAALHRVEHGASSVTVPDLYGGDDLTIELDPQKKPAEAAEALFKRARRIERQADRMQARLDSLDAEEAALEPVAHALTTASPQALLDQARNLVRQGALQAGEIETAAPSREQERRRPYRSFELAGGWEVWVGRSNADNDELTHRLAAPHDIWLHAAGTAGAHVILRRPPGYKGNPPASILEEAAAYAAQFSDARHSRTVPVTYAERRYVRKPRRSAPGTAVCIRSRTVMVTPRDRQAE